ncbi:hypothetical protein HOO65_010189 [Ceratocystis lukuohia]|uniref:Uncharacterized protein n=1 Tax=Ceratocystis lukuohia TaxID=2019550 RepID=A0ABR4MRC0_9PEZI
MVSLSPMRTALVVFLCIVTVPLAIFACITTAMAFAMLFFRVSLVYLDLVLQWVPIYFGLRRLRNLSWFFPFSLLGALHVLLSTSSPSPQPPQSSDAILSAFSTTPMLGLSPVHSRRGSRRGSRASSFSAPSITPSGMADDSGNFTLPDPGLLRTPERRRGGGGLNRTLSSASCYSYRDLRPLGLSGESGPFPTAPYWDAGVVGDRSKSRPRSRGDSFKGFSEGRDRGTDPAGFNPTWTSPWSGRLSPGYQLSRDGYFDMRRATSHEALVPW